MSDYGDKFRPIQVGFNSTYDNEAAIHAAKVGIHIVVFFLNMKI